MADDSFNLTRRQFTLALGGAISSLPYLNLCGAEPGSGSPAWMGSATVKVIYLTAKPSWPRPDVDLNQDVAGIEAKLGELTRRYPGQIRFTGGEIVGKAAADGRYNWDAATKELAAVLANSDDADVILAFNMTCYVRPLVVKLAEFGKPTLLFSVPYAGHDWVTAANYIQRGARFELIASSDFTDLDPYVPLFRTIHHMRHSKVLLVNPQATHPGAAAYTKAFGTAFGYFGFNDINEAFKAADVSKAEALAGEFIRAAVKTIEPTRSEIVDSFRLHLALQDLLCQEKANAISIDCLGGFGSGKLPAYPCVSFSRLNDAGMYGVCECDLDSTMTQLTVTPFSGRPGFVTDPVFDTSRNEVIHAHCVSATRLRGINDQPCPYIIRNHLEDHKGVSMQVLAPAGDPVTVARFAAGPEKMMLSTAESLGNVDTDRGCRTKVRTKVKDARKLLANWSAAVNTGPTIPGMTPSLHRVLFYGDHTEEIERLGRLAGFQVVHEA